jgi:RimJ/RimL family protein N-acetyltransferase
MNLKTNRLKLLEVNEQYFDLICSLLMDPEVMEYFPAVLDKDKSEQWCKILYKDYQTDGAGWWTIFLKETNEFIGHAWILARPMENQTEYLIGYMLHKQYWNKGYITEAARSIIDFGLHTLNLKRIVCLVRPENVSSIRVAEKLNLKYIKQVEYKGFLHNMYLAD